MPTPPYNTSQLGLIQLGLGQLGNAIDVPLATTSASTVILPLDMNGGFTDLTGGFDA